MKARISSAIAALSCAACVLLPARTSAQPVAVAHAELHKYVANATDTAGRAGSWSDPSTWSRGVVPGNGARVAIPAGVAVTVDREIATAYDWLRVDGTLRFRPDVSTSLVVDSVVAMGRIEIGTAEAPIRADVTARLIFRSPGTAIDHAHDPLELTRGLMGMSPVSIYGAPKREISALAVQPAGGATSLQLDSDPTGWKVGDEVLVAPTIYGTDEVVKVTSINGRTIGFSPALKHTRQNVPEPHLRSHVGNLTRNVVIATDAAQAGDPRLQGHVMLMGGGHRIFYAAFNDLGRTRARNADTDSGMPVTDPIILADGTVDRQLVPECMPIDNVRGRYSLHVHNPGPGSPLSIFEGVVVRVQRNKGFKVGIQNHSGHVAVRRAVVHQIDGSGIFTEEGDERGEIRDSLVVHSFGSGVQNPELPRDTCLKSQYPEILARRRTDFGHKGNGIWLQGGQVDAVGNILAGHDNAGIEQETSGLARDDKSDTVFVVRYPVALLREGDWWLPSAFRVAGATIELRVPPSLITDNQMYGNGGTRRYPAKAGLSISTGLHLEKWDPRPKNLVARNLIWNSPHCITGTYSSWTRLEDQTCVAGYVAIGGYNSDGMKRKGIQVANQDGRLWDFLRVTMNGYTLDNDEHFRPAADSTFCDVMIDGVPYAGNSCDGAPPPPPPAAPRSVRILR